MWDNVSLLENNIDFMLKDDRVADISKKAPNNSLS